MACRTGDAGCCHQHGDDACRHHEEAEECGLHEVFGPVVRVFPQPLVDDPATATGPSASEVSRAARVTRSSRIASATDHAWNGQPRGGGAARHRRSRRCDRAPASSRCCEQRLEEAPRASRLASSVPPRTRTHASTNGPEQPRPDRALVIGAVALARCRPRSAARSPARPARASGGRAASAESRSHAHRRRAARARRRAAANGQAADGEDLIRPERGVDACPAT